jgi:hypothetical protein
MAKKKIDLKKLAKILGMLGSDAEGERDNAIKTALEMMKSAGATWQDVIKDPPPHKTPKAKTAELAAAAHDIITADNVLDARRPARRSFTECNQRGYRGLRENQGGNQVSEDRTLRLRGNDGSLLEAKITHTPIPEIIVSDAARECLTAFLAPLIPQPDQIAIVEIHTYNPPLTALIDEILIPNASTWGHFASSQLLTCTFHQLSFRAFSLESKPQPFFLTPRHPSRSRCRQSRARMQRAMVHQAMSRTFNVQCSMFGPPKRGRTYEYPNMSVRASSGQCSEHYEHEPRTSEQAEPQ